MVSCSGGISRKETLRCSCVVFVHFCLIKLAGCALRFFMPNNSRERCRRYDTLWAPPVVLLRPPASVYFVTLSIRGMAATTRCVKSWASRMYGETYEHTGVAHVFLTKERPKAIHTTQKTRKDMEKNDDT